MSRGQDTWRGNKAALPSKPCAHCGRSMSWRKAWARCWDEVKHCSDRCRAEARVLGRRAP